MIFSFFKKLYGWRDLLFALTTKELKTRYKSAFLGFLWAFLNPLLQMAVLSIVFMFIVRIPVKNYPLFLFCGLLPWTFFSQSLISGTGSLTANRDLIKKSAFPREILPLSVILSNLINLILSLAILLPAILIFANISWPLILLPFAILLHVIFTVGIVLIASSLDIYYRDVSFIIQALTMAWFYLTPVIYPLSMVPQRFAGLYAANPMAGITSLYRFALL
ncbi:MAG: ABC transporter permease, partial [Candidatus Nealsonbacteria bacterium]|nr:ABC transporter permease [Candidatus Nealsonbacteria bacterium]